MFVFVVLFYRLKNLLNMAIRSQICGILDFIEVILVKCTSNPLGRPATNRPYGLNFSKEFVLGAT